MEFVWLPCLTPPTLCATMRGSSLLFPSSLLFRVWPHSDFLHMNGLASCSSSRLSWQNWMLFGMCWRKNMHKNFLCWRSVILLWLVTGYTTMSSLLRHRLRNNTNRTLYLREVHSDGCYMGVTRLDPYETRGNFPAAIYFNHNFLYIPHLMYDCHFCRQIRGIWWPHSHGFSDIDEGSNSLIVSGIRAESTDYFPCRKWWPLIV